MATNEVNIIEPTQTTSTQKPQMVLTQRFIYVTSPTTGELLMFNSKNTSDLRKIKVSNTPYRLSIMGFENSADH